MVHVIAGEALGAKAVIETRTPIGYLHWIFSPGASVDVPVPADRAAYVIDGTIACGSERAERGRMIVFAPGAPVALHAITDTRIALLRGAPLDGRSIGSSGSRSGGCGPGGAASFGGERQLVEFPRGKSILCRGGQMLG